MSATNLPEETPSEERSNVRPLLIILIVLCSYYIIGYALRLDERDRMEARIVAQREANAEALARNALLRDELAGASRPTHIDEIARKVLDMAKPNDVLLVPIDLVDEAAEAAAVEAAAEEASTDPLWRQWLELFVPLD